MISLRFTQELSNIHQLTLTHEITGMRLSTWEAQSELRGQTDKYNVVICQGQCQDIMFVQYVYSIDIWLPSEF